MQTIQSRGVTDAGGGQLTVRELVAEPLLKDSVITGGPALERTVSWCLPLSEVRQSDPAHARDDSDLTGVAVHLPADALHHCPDSAHLIEDLAARGAASLIVRSRPEAAELATATEAAERSGIALLAVGTEGDYRTVSRLVGQKALAYDSHVLEYGTQVHEVLAEVLARGAGVPAMAQSIAGLAASAVLVLDNARELVTHARTSDLPVAPGDIVPALGGRLPEAAPGGEAGVGHAAHGHSTDHVIEFPAVTVHTVVAPVVFGGEPYGWLCLVESSCPADGHDLAQHRVVAEHGATLIGSEMLRQRSMRAAEERARGDFIDALVHGRFADAHELRARAPHHDFDVDGRYVVLLASGPALRGTAERAEPRKSAGLARLVAALAARDDLCTLTTMIGPLLVVVREIRSDTARASEHNEDEKHASRFAHELHRLLSERLGPDVRVAYGRAGESAEGVASSYYEARVTMELAKHVEDADVRGYAELRVYAVLRDLALKPTGRDFAQEILEPLRRSSGQAKDLEEVVVAYIDSAGNLNAAARRLGLHRNTTLYKLERASRVLRMDLRTANAQFMVWLALYIDTLVSVSDSLSEELSWEPSAPGG